MHLEVLSPAAKEADKDGAAEASEASQADSRDSRWAPWFWKKIKSGALSKTRNPINEDEIKISLILSDIGSRPTLQVVFRTCVIVSC